MNGKENKEFSLNSNVILEMYNANIIGREGSSSSLM